MENKTQLKAGTEALNKALVTSSADWKLIAHSHQIADTGDYDGCYEVTNGNVSLFTKDDDDEAIEPVVKALNESGINFYIDDSDKWELQAIRDENKRLHYMIDNGLGWDDMKNDVKYPTEL
jgi:hypothetical protein